MLFVAFLSLGAFHFPWVRVFLLVLSVMLDLWVVNVHIWFCHGISYFLHLQWLKALLVTVVWACIHGLLVSAAYPTSTIWLSESLGLCFFFNLFYCLYFSFKVLDCFFNLICCFFLIFFKGIVDFFQFLLSFCLFLWGNFHYFFQSLKHFFKVIFKIIFFFIYVDMLTSCSCRTTIFWLCHVAFCVVLTLLPIYLFLQSMYLRLFLVITTPYANGFKAEMVTP